MPLRIHSPSRSMGGLLASIAICCLAVSAAVADEWTREAVVSWKIGSGLPGQTISSITQTEDGYLWLCTNGGIARFDGTAFSLSAGQGWPADATEITSGRGNTLWIGTAAGSVYRAVNGRCEQVIPPGTEGLKSGIYILREDADGRLWITSFANDVGCFSDGKLEMKNAWRKEVGGGFQVRLDPMGKPVINSGVGLWRVIGGQLEEAFRWPGGTAYLAAGRQGWWLTGQNGVALWRDRGGPFTIPGKPAWGGSQLTLGIEDRRDNLWLATNGHGLFRYGRDGAMTAVDTSAGLAGNSAKTLFVDRDGSLWVGTDGAGLSRITPGLFTIIGKVEGLSSAELSAVCGDSRGVIWVGSRGGGLYRIEGKSITAVTGPDASWSTLNVGALAADASDTLWIGTRDRGLWKLKSGQPAASLALPLEAKVEALLVDHSQRVWVGQSDVSQVTVIEEGRPRVIELYGASAPVGVRFIVEDAQQTIWLGTDGSGIWKLDRAKFTRHAPADSAGIKSVSAMLADDSGGLWVALKGGGIARLDQGAVRQWGRLQGLPEGEIRTMLDDGRGNLWCATADRVFKMEKKALDAAASGGNVHVTQFDRADGLVPLQIAAGQSAACRSTSGRLWFATNQGLATLQPADYRPAETTPPVLIGPVRADGWELLSDSASVSAPRRVEFAFAALDLAHPHAGKLMYRLDGADSQWRTSDSPAIYDNLPSGIYHFRVKAANRDGVWGSEGTSLRFVVPPPFWRTPKFIAIGLIALSIAGFGVLWTILRWQYARKLAALRLQQALEHERARIARDLHDRLGTFLTEIAMLGDSLKQGANSGQEPAEAQRISGSARASIRALDQTVWALNSRNDSAESLVTYLTREITDWCGRADLRTRFDIPPEQMTEPMGGEIRLGVLLACQEVVHNVIKHARASTIEVAVSERDDRLVIRITDDGAGFDLGQHRSGNGLANLRERLSSLGGEVIVESTPGRGTTVTLSVPLQPTASHSHHE